MEGCGHRYGKPGKTGRVLIEDLKEWINSVYKKNRNFFRITNPLVRGWKRKIIQFPLPCWPERYQKTIPQFL